MKKTAILLIAISLFSLPVFASCPKATPTSEPSFCETFKVAAQCHCANSGLPAGMCRNMNLLYKRMMDTFGSLHRACEFQHDTSVEECMNDWNFYRYSCPS